MTSPRKFAEKIALIQQKQAQDDAAFNTILNEVEAAKQKAERGHSSRSTADVPSRKHERNLHQESNGSERLLQLPENPSTWRRTHSDSSLHTAMTPQVVTNYHTTFDRFPSDQPMNYEENHQAKFDFPNYQMAPPTTNHFQPSYYQYDLNNNNSYANGQLHSTYPFASVPTTPLPPTMASGANAAVVPTQLPAQQHTLLAGRFSGGNPTSNVLMLPPNQHARANGGSLPDLRTGNPYQSSSTMSFTHMPSPPTGENARFRSTSPHPNGDADLLSLGPQQQLPSSIGPLKSSPSMRRRHSPIGDVKPSSSPRRQNSPSPDPSALASQLAAVAATNAYRGEPSSPQSQSSYSPQNSPHLISSPVGNEHNSYSPPSLTENQQTQPYHTLPTHFDRINLDANQAYPNTSQDHSAMSDSFSSFLDDLSMNFSQPTTLTNPSTQKSPTIPNIILTGVDSSKLDLTDELENLIDPLNYDDFANANEDLWKMLDS